MRLFLENECFPWGGLPYPHEHATAGIAQIERGEIALAQEMASVQEMMIDHYGQPLIAFFRQERGISMLELKAVTERLFTLLQRTPQREYQAINEALGICVKRTQDSSALLFGSGCKSGMGTFLVDHSGVLTFGPQLSPLGNCRAFGLAGRGQNLEVTETSLRYCCRLAAPHERDTGISWLEDSGYSAAWLEGSGTLTPEGLVYEGIIEGFRDPEEMHLTFFGKAHACWVGRTHKLNPCSLDRYQGPPQPVVLDEVVIVPGKGCGAMDIIPLAGDDGFWGADFLVAFRLATAAFQCALIRA